MAVDARIIAAWDRAAAPISRYFDLIEALGTGGDERQIVRGFRSLDKELSSVGIKSESPAVYRSGRPISLWLITAMVDDLAAGSLSLPAAWAKPSKRSGVGSTS
jgi:hypothetical protein